MIYIYGAGNYGQKLMHMLKENNISDISGYVVSDSYEQTNTVVDGIPVYGLSTIRGKNVDLFLLAVSNRTDRIIIYNGLIDKGVNPSRIIDCASLIESSLSKDSNFCNICGAYTSDFLPFGGKSELFKEAKVLGAGLREKCICPRCYSLDRTRWLFYLICQKTDILESECSVLHFAPEKQISSILSSTDLKTRYFSCDLIKGAASNQADITNIPFQDEIFDYIIAGHVLQQVRDEKRAFSEMKRVLKNDGTIIISFPICWDRKTYQNDKLTTKAERERYYGEIYGCRLYGNDYKERLESYSLQIESFSPKDILEEDVIRELSLISDYTILFCKKK